MKKIPEFLQQILLKEYGEDLKNKIIKGYNTKKPVTLRLNTLKDSVKNFKFKFD